MTLHLEVYQLPKLPNQLLRKHWAIVMKEKNKWHSLIKLGAQWKEDPLSKASLTLIRHSSKEPDADGLAGSFKFVVDGLVKAGVIVDDKPSIIGSPNYQWQKCAPKLGKIEVKVEWE